jgi:hypothetical protein
LFYYAAGQVEEYIIKLTESGTCGTVVNGTATNFVEYI